MTISIQFDNVSKWFTLYHGESRTLQERVLDIFRPKHQGTSSKEQFWALRNVSFDIEQGQTVGLVGSNGSGKSTALKMMTRILEPTSGTVNVHGRMSALLELGAGFHPDLTGRENVFLNGSLLGLSRRDMARCFDEIVQFSELEQFIDMPVKHYSSGMYMRLAFSVAIHVDPEILLVDEVLAVGDGNFQRKCMERIAALRRAGVTIVLVSHDLDTVARLCHQVVWLDKGVVREVGESREIINRYIAHINKQQQAHLVEKNDAAGGTDGAVSAQNNGAHLSPVNLPDVAITQIQAVDESGEVSSTVTVGDSLTIRIYYQAKILVESPVFGLALHRDDDVHVSGPNTQDSNYVIDRIEGNGYVDYTVKALPLMAGRYFVSASIFDADCTFCHHYVHQICSFIVQPRSSWDHLGVVKMAAEWRLGQSADADAADHQEFVSQKVL